MLFSLFFAPLIVNLVFGPKYVAAIPIFRYMTLAMIPFLFSILTVTPIIYSFNQPDFIAKTTILQVILLIGIDILLIPSLGAAGPALSLAISNVVVLILTGGKLFQLLK
jgi:O-antigen/teichoic acid export membrane protein